MKLPKPAKIGIIIILIFLVILNLTHTSNKIKNFFYLISSPIQKPLWSLGHKVSDVFAIVGETERLKKENEELKFKTQSLISQSIQLSQTKKENESLRQALGVGLEKEFKLVLAQVIGKDISQDFILINKGAKDGVSKGMPVITPQKALVGKISEAYDNFSRVILISNKDSSFDAEIHKNCSMPYISPEKKQENYISGIVKGKGDFKLSYDLILHEREIQEGDCIITSPLGGNFPKGILVGQIVKVVKSDIEPFQQAQITPAFDIKELEAVFIITEY